MTGKKLIQKWFESHPEKDDELYSINGKLISARQFNNEVQNRTLIGISYIRSANSLLKKCPNLADFVLPS